MFDQLTESTNTQNEPQGHKSYFVVTGLLVGALFLSGVVWSLYGKNLVLGSGDLELAEIISPVAETEDTPKPKPKPEPERQQASEPTATQTTRNSNMLRTDEAHLVPNGVSTTQNTSKARTSDYILKPGPETDAAQTGSGRKGPNVETSSSSECTENCGTAEQHIPEPPPVKKDEPKKERIISGGVVNGTATSLPVPAYPAAAKAIGASGAVQVQVTIDEAGSVTSAKAVSGHPLLRQPAEKAARAAKFKPTLLSREPVKVTGVIVYNFTK